MFKVNYKNIRATSWTSFWYILLVNFELFQTFFWRFYYWIRTSQSWLSWVKRKFFPQKWSTSPCWSPSATPSVPLDCKLSETFVEQISINKEAKISKRFLLQIYGSSIVFLLSNILWADPWKQIPRCQTHLVERNFRATSLVQICALLEKTETFLVWFWEPQQFTLRLKENKHFSLKVVTTTFFLYIMT